MKDFFQERKCGFVFTHHISKIKEVQYPFMEKLLQRKSKKKSFLNIYEYLPKAWSKWYIWYLLKTFPWDWTIHYDLPLFSHEVVANSCEPMDYNPPGSSVHGILQAKILEWVAIYFSRGYFWLGNPTWVSCTAGRFFTNLAVREAQFIMIEN